MWSSARSEAALAAALPVPIEIRPMRNARRLRLRFDEASRTLRLTCPWRTSRKAALAWDPAAPRTPVVGDGEMRVGGPSEGFARRIELFIKRRALDVMSREAADYAEAAGVTVRSVSVGDAGTRWGSCSSEGKIRLSWRLILALPNARRFVVAHEVAHLVHLDHSAKFKALEARLYGPGLAEAKAQLRAVGPRLKRVGRRG